MGLDLSKNCPGISIVDINTSKVIFIDKYKQKGDKDFFFRMIEIREWLYEIIKTFKVKNIMLEAPFISAKTAKSNNTLLKMHGMLGHYMMSLGTNIYTISPTSARAFLKIKPNKKEIAFEYVKENFPELRLKDFKNDNDIADSIIIALSFFSEKKQLLN
jgi:Holliday junction resolvasome RuvABC endonuclease subunit